MLSVSLRITDYLQSIVQVVKFVDGEPCIIQAENSQVKLHVPKGVHGAILANVHTNHAQFMHHVPKNDCLVAPICEYHLQQLYQTKLTHPKDVKYRIEMPHIVKDVDKVRPHIRILHGNLRNGTATLEVERHSSRNHEGKTSFNIDENLVTIHTNHFSGYIITAKHINCCAQSALALLFGSLQNIQQAMPLATVKIYLSSRIADCEHVRVFQKSSKTNIETNLE